MTFRQIKIDLCIFTKIGCRIFIEAKIRLNSREGRKMFDMMPRTGFILSTAHFFSNQSKETPLLVAILCAACSDAQHKIDRYVGAMAAILLKILAPRSPIY